jgi:hypothetical protein
MGVNWWKGGWKRGLADVKQFFARGMVELQNATYTESRIAVPQVVSAAQLRHEIEDSMQPRLSGHEQQKDLDQGLSR